MSHARRTTVVTGAIVGILAFIVGYGMTWILAGTKANQLGVGGPFGGSVPNWKGVMWVFYDAHFVGTRTAGVAGPGGTNLGGGVFVDTIRLLGLEYLYVLPVLLLLAAGATVAWRAEVTSLREGFVAGMTVVVGYVGVVVLGMMASQQTGVGPGPLRAVVIAGLVYPIAFGAVGGAAFELLGRAESERGREDTVH